MLQAPYWISPKLMPSALGVSVSSSSWGSPGRARAISMLDGRVGVSAGVHGVVRAVIHCQVYTPGKAGRGRSGRSSCWAVCSGGAPVHAQKHLRNAS